MVSQKAMLDDVTSTLERDAKEPFPKFPSQSVYAIKNGEVAKALTLRLERGERLQSIRALEYDFSTGLNRLCFEFGNSSSSLSPTSILVLLDTHCKVVGLVDPFNADQPNRMVPPLSTIGGGLPFVLERSSAVGEMAFDQAAIDEHQSRIEGFMARVFGRAWGGFGGGGLNVNPCGDAVGTECSFCSEWYMSVYPAATPRDRGVRQMDCTLMDRPEDDCGIPF